MWTFFESCWEQRPTVEVTALSSPLSLGPQPTTTTHTGNKKNTGTMIATIRRPPAAPIREVSAIAVRRAIDYDDSDAAI
jgi:hypothetical protein